MQWFRHFNKIVLTHMYKIWWFEYQKNGCKFIIELDRLATDWLARYHGTACFNLSYSILFSRSIVSLVMDQVLQRKEKYCQWNYGILLPKLFWPTVRKNCSSDWEKLLKFRAEGQEFARILRSLEYFFQTVKGQNNFW